MTRTGAGDVCGDEITVTTTRGPIPRYCPACRGVARQPAIGLMHGRLAVSCWCEATVVYVPRDDVYAGLTGACPRPACRATDRRHRPARQAS